MKESVLVYLIPTLWKHKGLILGSTLIAGVLVAAVMLAQPNYYRSTSLFYPVNSSLLDPSASINQASYFGDDRDIDRLLSIATSLDLKHQLIDAFDLATHYDIDTSSLKGKVKLIKTFTKNMSVFKTQYDAIQLSIEDQDPLTAQKLTKAAQDYIDDMIVGVIRQTQERLFDQVSEQRKTLQIRLSQVVDSLSTTRSLYGIYSSESQAEALTSLEITNPLSSSLRKKISDYNRGIAAVTSLESTQTLLNSQLNGLGIKAEQLALAIGADKSALHIIEQPSLPLEKSRPKRSLYVLAAMLGIGLLACALVLIREQITQSSS